MSTGKLLKHPTIHYLTDYLLSMSPEAVLQLFVALSWNLAVLVPEKVVHTVGDNVA